VIANTGDDIDIYGATVSPDPDLTCFWLADRIDARGWGIDGDTFNVMDELRGLGRDVWFSLGDRDLAWCLERRRMLDEGLTATAALAHLSAWLGVTARVLPASDDPVHTWIRSGGRWLAFQEFMVRERAAAPIEEVQFRGAPPALPSGEVLEALAGAGAIVIGPSNPVISIGPMLALVGMRGELRDCAAPVVAVSPIVGGEVLKGPTAAFMEHAGWPLTAGGVAAAYDGLLDGLVSDEPGGVAGLRTLQADTRMDSASDRRRVAQQTLDFALSLASGS
jgi:LPPG:FO 2-phospho-L-lactate transferase